MGLFDIFKKKKPEVIMKEDEKLSVELAEKIVEKIEEMSKKTAYKLSIDMSRKPALADTKFGGTPYWDLSREYPVSSKGSKLLLLAQINLSDVPDCGLLPSKGLLQFFIGNDDLYGMDFNDATSNDPFRVIYHETIDENVTESDVLALGIDTSVTCSDDDEVLLPFTGECAVNIEKSEVSVGTEDYMYEKFMGMAAKEMGIILPENQSAYSILPEEIFEKECDAQRNIKHWLFGYAYFTQYDPRDYGESNNYILLFQMDSDYEKDSKFEILWGDSGVGNFFIKPDDLKNLDFTKVLYNWDCC